MAVYINSLEKIKRRLKIDDNGEAQKLMTATCAKKMDKYVPYRNGDLAKTVIQGGEPTSNVTANSITYSQKYARYVYKGISRSGKNMVYSKDKHNLANSYWDRRMISAEMKDVVKEVQDFIGGKR